METEELPQAAVAKVLAEYKTGATASARRTFRAQFLKQVDPDRILPLVERAQLADQARRDHYASLGRRSGAARRARKAAASGAR